MSYTTPFVVETPSGPELIVNSSERVDAYDPRSGAFLWHVGGSNQFPIPAPTFHDGVLYLRVEAIFSASPVAGDGKIYFVSETGETIVVKAGRQPEVLARNDLGERLIASPAISHGQLFIRSDGQLFAIGNNESW